MNGNLNRFAADYSLPVDVDASGVDEGVGDGGGGGGGLGNLADELADVLDDEEGEDYGYGYAPEIESRQDEADDEGRGVHVDAKATAAGASQPEESLSQYHLNRLMNNVHNRKRRSLSTYDGSDYGHDSDLEEASDIPPRLARKMGEIESLARRGLENNGSEYDNVIEGFIMDLKELGTQSSIENSATRCVISYSSIHSIPFH